MAAVRVKVNPKVYDWVRTQIDIDLLKLPFQNDFEKWISGEKDPTFKQIQKFSQVTHIPLGYFFLEEPPVENNDLIAFRTVDSMELETPSRELVDTIDGMEKIQDWMKDYLAKNFSSRLQFVASVDLDNDTHKVVEDIRNTLSLKIDWYKESKEARDSFKIIRRKLEQIGVIVMMNGVVGSNTRRSLNINEFRAFTLIDNYAPLIFINAKDSENGRLFSLFHELAHIWYGRQCLFNDNYYNSDIKRIETACNAVAAELLLPNNFFVQSWNKKQHETEDKKIQRIAREFSCGTAVVARRALDNGFIGYNKYKNQLDFVKEKYSETKQKGDGGDYYNTKLTQLDHRVLFALHNSAYEGTTTFTDVYRLTNTNRTTFDSLVEKARGNYE